MLQRFSVLLAAALICTVVFGAVLHSIIPHSHGHDHGGETAIWQSLHGSLRHEDKKIIALVDTLAVVGSVALFTVVAMSVIETAHAYAFDSALSRGVLPHRRFG